MVWEEFEKCKMSTLKEKRRGVSFDHDAADDGNDDAATAGAVPATATAAATAEDTTSASSNELHRGGSHLIARQESYALSQG